MREEQVTKALLNVLQQAGWTIVAFDFPQSGTGKMLHPNANVSEKNKGGIIPDVVTVKGDVCLFFENKDRVVISDFDKLASIKNENAYSNAIAALLAGYVVNHIYYGIGLPTAKWNAQGKSAAAKVDFVIGVTEDGTAEWLWNLGGVML